MEGTPAAQETAPPMIVGHLRRISPPLTQDHETAGQTATGREETPWDEAALPAQTPGHVPTTPRIRTGDPGHSIPVTTQGAPRKECLTGMSAISGLANRWYATAKIYHEGGHGDSKQKPMDAQ
jgi:hypothetical protein